MTYIDKAIVTYKKAYQRKFVGLHAICFDGNVSQMPIPLLLNWDDIRVKFTKRNT